MKTLKDILTFLKYALGFAILFWLTSICGLMGFALVSLLKNNILGSFAHIIASAFFMFLFAWYAFGEIGKHTIEFTVITLLSLLEFHISMKFQAFESHQQGIYPFFIVFFFMAIFTIPTLFASFYLVHKFMFFILKLKFSYK